MALEDFIQTFFIDPINLYQGYNPVNTLVYGAILLAVAFLLVFPQLDKRGVKFNFRFALAVMPYILFGIGLRIVEDMKILQRSANPLELGYYFISPGIWILIGLTTIAALVISILVARKTGMEFVKPFAAIGLVLAVPTLLFDFVNFMEWQGFLLAFVMVLAVTGIVVIGFNIAKRKLLQDRLNIMALAGQAMDGSATFVATQVFSCGEQHPLSEVLLNMHGLVFVAVKIALVLLILYYVDKEIENKNLAGFIKLFLVILGFATGTRTLFTIGAGTCL